MKCVFGGPRNTVFDLPRGTLAMAAIVAAGILAGSDAARAQGIEATVHDLTGGGVDDICVFCHTPHSARPASEIEVPLWNKPATGSVYDTYDSSTIDGDIIALGSVSSACLTCHDGTQSTDTVINAPGTDGVDPIGTEIRGGGRFLDDPTKGDFIGTDLTNDHPVGVQYGGFGTPPIDPDFVSSGDGLQVALINGLNRWWVDTEGAPNGTREKTDMILYSRTNSVGSGQPEPFVECGSCHDPHSDANDLFLRIENLGSAVCTACHIK